MAEKRKPDWVLLLRKEGNNVERHKIELFRAKQFAPELSRCFGFDQRWRVRLNGKWWPLGKKEFFTKTKIKELIFKHVT